MKLLPLGSTTIPDGSENMYTVQYVDVRYENRMQHVMQEQGDILVA